MSSYRTGGTTVLLYFLLIVFTLSNPDGAGKSGVKTGATVLAEDNSSLF